MSCFFKCVSFTTNKSIFRVFTIDFRAPNISQAAVEQVVEQELDNQFSREPTVAGAIYEVVHKEFIKLEAYWLRKEEEEVWM